MIDARDEEMGAWFEARILKISPKNTDTTVQTGDKETTDDEQSSSCADAHDVNADGSKSCAANGSAVKTSQLIDDVADDGFLYSIVFEWSASSAFVFAGVHSSFAVCDILTTQLLMFVIRSVFLGQCFLLLT